MKTIVTTAITAAALVLGTGVAHAQPFSPDEQGYLDALRSGGVSVANEAGAVKTGTPSAHCWRNRKRPLVFLT